MNTEVTSPRTPADSSISGHISDQTALPRCEFDRMEDDRKVEALEPVSTGAAIDIRCPEFDPRITAKEFLAVADRIVDQLSAARIRQGAGPLPEDMANHLRGAYLAEYIKARYGSNLRRMDSRALPPRFKREPQIFLGNLRFGRTRLFLSKFIGDLAWRGVNL